MSGSLLYLDSSAIVKLVVPEPESAALFALLERWPERISSALARVEVPRALRRAALPADVSARGEQVLKRLAFLQMDDRILATAARLLPPDLRTLDAIHLASALAVQSDLAALVTYDRRLADSAARANITVWAPV
jgi:hypothetical protein